MGGRGHQFVAFNDAIKCRSACVLTLSMSVCVCGQLTPFGCWPWPCCRLTLQHFLCLYEEYTMWQVYVCVCMKDIQCDRCVCEFYVLTKNGNCMVAIFYCRHHHQHGWRWWYTYADTHTHTHHKFIDANLMFAKDILNASFFVCLRQLINWFFMRRYFVWRFVDFIFFFAPL